jgi:hypothetical protein
VRKGRGRRGVEGGRRGEAHDSWFRMTRGVLVGPSRGRSVFEDHAARSASSVKVERWRSKKWDEEFDG